MGNSYVNTTARAGQAAVVAALEAEGLKAVVAPERGGLTVFSDARSEEQDVRVIEALGARLSTRLAAPCFTVLNHDDAILATWLFEAGRTVDTYNSDPGWLDGAERPPEGGDAARIAGMFGANPAAVEAVLRAQEEPLDLFALYRHQALCRALGLPEEVAGFGYDYAIAGDFEGEPWLGGLIVVGG